MTIMEALQWANNKLRKAGVESPMLDAEVLLAFTLDVSKAWLFAHFADKLKTHQREKFHECIEQRANRIPVAYIVGHKAFYGREFQVNKNVLIPRPDTETLIDLVLERLQGANPERTLICDIGTGSGAIAVTLAAETSLPVIAIDVSEPALKTAQKNAELLCEDGQIEFQLGNLAEPLIRIFKSIRGQQDVETSDAYPFKTLVITANLPYLSKNRMDTLQEEVRHEPTLALEAGLDGLDLYWELVKSLRTHRDILPRECVLYIEIDPDQTLAAERLVRHNFPSSKPKTYKDLQGRDRVVMAAI